MQLSDIQSALSAAGTYTGAIPTDILGYVMCFVRANSVPRGIKKVRSIDGTNFVGANSRYGIFHARRYQLVFDLTTGREIFREKGHLAVTSDYNVINLYRNTYYNIKSEERGAIVQSNENLTIGDQYECCHSGYTTRTYKDLTFYSDPKGLNVETYRDGFYIKHVPTSAECDYYRGMFPEGICCVTLHGHFIIAQTLAQPLFLIKNTMNPMMELCCDDFIPCAEGLVFIEDDTMSFINYHGETSVIYKGDIEYAYDNIILIKDSETRIMDVYEFTY